MKNTSATFRTLQLTLLLIIGLENHQAIGQVNFRLGPALGAGIRMLNGNAEGEIGSGYYGGIVASMNLTPKLRAMPALVYSQKGYYYYEGFDLLFGSDEYNQDLRYLDLHIPVAIRLSRLISIKAGLQAGLLLSARYTEIYEDEVWINSNIKPYMHTMDYGAVLGVLLELKMGLGFDITANYGLRNGPDPDSSFWDSTFGSMDGTNFLATTGVYFLIGKRTETE